jgi:hypothetical protein
MYIDSKAGGFIVDRIVSANWRFADNLQITM